MALNEIEQFRQQIKESHHILITFKKDFSVDAIASALALYLVIQKMAGQNAEIYGGEKLIDIVCDDFVLPGNLKFLPAGKLIEPKITNLQKFIITLDTGGSEIDEFSYNLENDKLKIFIIPKAGSFTKENIATENSNYKYDLIITLDTSDLESLGKLYQNFTDFFFNTNIVNIDHKSENEHFGQVNLTNLNAVATAEILFNLINELDKELIDKDIATCLLAGLIAETKSFKTPNVTPRTLAIASHLMAAEADRETIIKNLYRSRTLSTLKLWGRALARLKSEEGNKLIWSILTEHDFVEARAEDKDLPEVIDELISFVPGPEIIILIYQYGGKICVLVKTFKDINALYLTKEFRSVGSKNIASFCLLDKNLLEAEKEVIEKIKQNLSRGR